MTKYFPLLFCFLCIGLLTLSGCSSLQSPSWTSPHNAQEADNQSTEEPGPEERSYLDLEDIEPETQLAEELSDLEKAGSWGPHHEELLSTEEASLFDFPLTENNQVDFYLQQFQGKQRRNFQRWLERSTQYQEFIEIELQQAGLPKDLFFLAMIESGFNPSAYSKAHAAGLWQFIRGTGKNYGLRIDSWVDERRDPIKATRAAIDYLSFLHEEFGDWYLAVAAYNAGEGKIARGLKRYQTNDFWELASKDYLSLETKRYVPKLIAAIKIAREPERYGFTEIDYKTTQSFDEIKVQPGTELAAVAATAETDVTTLRRLNNDLRKNQTPPGGKGYMLKVPAGTKELVAQNLDRLHPIVTTEYKTHTVKRGDTLTKICRNYQINKTTLLKANNLRTASLKRGQRLRIPYRTTKYVLLKEGETPASHFASTKSDGRMMLHTMRKGDTLSKVAKKYDVPLASIIQWNGIKDVRKVKAGEHIALFFGPQQGGQIELAENTNDSAPPLVLNETKKSAPGQVAAQAKRKPANILYRVKNGDSLWTIAKKFQVSPAQLKSWNNLPSNLIHPGSKLVVKKG